ncbi:MAG TPA: CoA transferase [Solirubrobacteraceae bacterium]|nr:CoA transferase [Solirubrobacteraceae bacterium]
MAIELTGPELAVETCVRRLAPLAPAPVEGHAVLVSRPGPVDGGATLAWDGPDLTVDLSWFGPAAMDGRAGSEAAVQALSGLMQVHGRDAGSPRRIGLEVASVTAGLLAAHATLAALVGAARGIPAATVRTSALEGALLLNSHRIAAATTGSEWVPVPPGPAPGPPFRSADGHWLELETLDASAWRAFWERLGAAEADLQWAWRLFRPRYFRGTCTLPPGLHEATRAHTLADLTAAAQACAVSLTAVRSYDEVLEEPGFMGGHPQVEALPRYPGAPEPAPEAAMAPARAPAQAWARASASEAELPLAGLRVIEATSRLQGPLAGRLLQTLGAHVVRVEPPGGDISRTVPPLVGEDGTFFLSFNRGKEPVELDLGRPEQRAELSELIAGADVFLHNWRPGRAAEWGLEAGDLAQVNPTLVYAHGSGWGALPGVSRLVGTDFLVQAYTGVAAGLSPAGRPSLPSRALLTDYMGALSTCEAALFGLYLRARTGSGQRVGGSLAAGAMALQAHVLGALAEGRERRRRRRGRPLWTLLDHPLATADGYLAVGIEGEEDIHRLADACELAPDTPSPEALEAHIAERIGAGVTLDCEERIAAAGVSCAAVRTDLATLPGDPRLARLFEPLGGSAWAPVAPWRLR